MFEFFELVVRVLLQLHAQLNQHALDFRRPHLSMRISECLCGSISAKCVKNILNACSCLNFATLFCSNSHGFGIGETTMRIEMRGTPVDILTEDETLSRIEKAMASRVRLQHVALNVAKLMSLQKNAELREDVISSDIVGIDGMGIVLAIKLLGYSNVTRMSGVDVMNSTLALCAREGYRPFFLGAKPDIVKAAVLLARTRYPGLVFAGYHDGYFKEQDEDDVLKIIQQSGADCLFIGMPTPRKERLLRMWRERLHVPFIMGVGGGLDVLAGKVKRAPLWMQKNGLEWVYRIYQEPGRMWWRYLSTNTVFAGYLLQLACDRAFQQRYKTKVP
jgi:N-acetylglucosaminyldiphosphoundecaprenol N-acetyl-beta-D-mannosaminyltransferase